MIGRSSRADEKMHSRYGAIMAKPTPELEDAVRREDLFKAVENATAEELAHLVAAEELFEKHDRRKKRSSRFSAASQALVGYVALAGFFANAFQNWSSARQSEIRARIDADRWEREFRRAQEADRYRAFFETSAFATDTSNADKRLVGYALLREFVDDALYNTKAVLMLEASLGEELRRDTAAPGLDDEVRNLVVAILAALSHTAECKSLERAARSIDKLAKNKKAWRDTEAAETFELFVRFLLGRAPAICPGLKEIRSVRLPLRDTLILLPEVGGLAARPDRRGRSISARDADRRLAEILRNVCKEEIEREATSDCPGILDRYRALCARAVPEPEDAAVCEVLGPSAGGGSR